MSIEELNEKLIYRIRLKMASCRTRLDVPEFKDNSIYELCFLIELLEIINTKESLLTANYIKELIIKAKNRTYKIGD